MDTQSKPRKGDTVEFLAGSTGTKLKGKVSWVGTFAPDFALEGLDESFTTDASRAASMTLAADLAVWRRSFQVGDTNLGDADFDALPEGAIVVDADGDAMQKAVAGDGKWYRPGTTTDFSNPTSAWAPYTLVWLPEGGE